MLTEGCCSLLEQVPTMLKQRADEEAITVFAENLKQLLLSPPLGEKGYWQ